MLDSINFGLDLEYNYSKVNFVKLDLEKKIDYEQFIVWI